MGKNGAKKPNQKRKTQKEGKKEENSVSENRYQRTAGVFGIYRRGAKEKQHVLISLRSGIFQCLYAGMSERPLIVVQAAPPPLGGYPPLYSHSISTPGPVLRLCTTAVFRCLHLERLFFSPCPPSQVICLLAARTSFRALSISAIFLAQDTALFVTELKRLHGN